jgi:hypothetical protein
MSTLSVIYEQTLPQTGTIYPDTVDERYFDYLREHISTIEANNEGYVRDRITTGCLKKVSTADGLYTEGVPIEYINIILDGIDELASDDNQLNSMLWLLQKTSARVYVQPRNRISSGDKHIGNIWIFDKDGFVQLFMVKQM